MSYRQTPHVQCIYVGTSAQTADFVCTGTNDDVVINAAIAAATTAGTSTVLLMPGTYYITNQINLNNNIHLTSMGLGTVAIVIASSFNDTSNTAGILAAGTEISTPIVLTADLADGYNYVQVSTSGGSGTEYALVQNDDFVMIRSNALWETTEQSGRTIAEYLRVNNASNTSNSLSVWGMARSTYKVSDSAEIYRETLMINPMISNIEMYQQAAAGTRTNPRPLIAFNRCLNGKVVNCRLHDNDQAGVLMEYSIGCSVLDSWIYQLYDNPTNSQYGYATQVLGSENTTIKGCHIYKVRHGLTTGGGSYGIARGLDFIGNTVSQTTNSCVDTHNQSETVNINGNVLNNSLLYAVFVRGRATNVIGNTVEWCGAGVQVGLTPYQVSGGSGTSTKIMGNTFRNIKVSTSVTTNGTLTGTGMGCVLDLTDNCIVQDNIFENIDAFGIQLQQKVSKCIIKGNTLLNCNMLNTSNVSAMNLQSNINSSTASITTFSTPTVTLTYTGTGFANYHVGQTIVISGSAANNGSFPITAVLSTSSLQYTNAGGSAPDANNGSISIFIEQNTDNVFENNTAINTAASNWDPNSTGGFAKYLCYDAGTSDGGANVRNIFKNNSAYTTLGGNAFTGLFNITNSNSYFAGNSNNESTPTKTNAGAITDLLFDGSPPDGTYATDTTDNYGYVRSGGSWYSIPTSGATLWEWVTGITGPTLKQVDNTIGSAVGQPLTIQSQNATGPTSTGGDLDLASGTGTTNPGGVNLAPGGVTLLSAINTSSNPNSLQFSSTTTTPHINQGQTTTGTGATLSIKAQNAAVTSGSAAGGGLTLSGGSSSGASSATNTGGNINIQGGTATNGTTNAGGSVSIQVGTGANSNGTINIGTTSATAVTITPNNTGANTLTWVAGATSVAFNQSSTSAASGATWQIIAQPTTFTGATATGGPLQLKAGNSTGTNTGFLNVGGDVILVAGNATSGSTNNGGNIILEAGAGATLNGQIEFKLGTNTAVSLSPSDTGANTLAWVAGSTSVTFQQTTTTTASSGANWSMTAQGIGTTTGTNTGGTLTLAGGAAAGSGATSNTGGNVVINAGSASGATTNTAGNVQLQVAGTTIAQVTANKFTTTKGRNQNVTNITTTYQMLVTDENVVVTTNSGAFTITMPASPTTGDYYLIKDGVGNANSNNLTVSGNGKNIDGSSTYLININYAAIGLLYNGTQWLVV